MSETENAPETTETARSPKRAAKGSAKKPSTKRMAPKPPVKTETDEERLARLDRLDRLYMDFEEQTRMVRSTRQLITTLAQRRRETAVALHQAGEVYSVIAARTGLSKSAVQQIIGPAASNGHA